MAHASTRPVDRAEQRATPADLAARLADFEAFAGVEPEALDWLVAHGDYLVWAEGAEMFAPGEAIDHMYVIVRGRYRVDFPGPGGRRDLGEFDPGAVTGVLPFSRMTHVTASLRVLEELHALRVPKTCFTELVQVSYRMAQNLVGLMSTRIRDFADLRAQNDKMMSLGKLSAGLAHELNNPAAAIVRSAEELYAELHNTPESFKAIMTMRITPEETDAINAIMFARLEQLAPGREDGRSAVQRLDDAEALEDWLDDHDLAADAELVESLNAARFTADDLERIRAICDGRSMQGLLAWLAKNVTLETLVEEIRAASARISELVGSVKAYTHMDRDAGRTCVDLRAGLHSTVVMLKHKFRQRGVALAKDLPDDLPPVLAWGGQLNQVYTNLIDNAVDAAGEGGHVTLRARATDDGQQVCVEVEDDGPGVPEDLRERIFEPFFTTKDVGEGTGMGLDIAQRILARHGSRLELESAPGRTVFRFCLGVG